MGQDTSAVRGTCGRSGGPRARRAAIRAGYGIGGQACFIADRDPELVRVLPELEMSFEIWLVTHPGLRRSARIRAVYDYLAEQLTAARPLLTGES
jgi:DNA-binding transcriptional LysR family regulator